MRFSAKAQLRTPGKTIFLQNWDAPVVVFDRFHLMKLLNEALNKRRKLLGIKVKKSRYLLLKNFVELTSEEKEQLEQVLNQPELLRIAYWMKEEFREIYETSKTVKSGGNRFNRKFPHTNVLFKPKALV